MSSRTASCSCGQLRVQVEGEPRVGVCHCLACQRRTGSAFAALARFPAPFQVFGTATEYARVGDQGARFIFRFCPVCGTTVFHTEEGDEASVSVASVHSLIRHFRHRKSRSTTSAGIRGCSCLRAR